MVELWKSCFLICPKRKIGQRRIIFIISKEYSVAYDIRKYLRKEDFIRIERAIPPGSKPGEPYGMAEVHKAVAPLLF